MLGAFSTLVKKLAENDELNVWEFSRALWTYSRFKCNTTHLTHETPLSEATMRVILYYFRFAELTMGKIRIDLTFADYVRHNDTIVCNEFNVDRKNLLYSHWGSRVGQYIVHHHGRIIWTFRPTLSPDDFVIDVDFESVPFLDGYAHRGMLREAEDIFGRVWSIIEPYKHFDFVLCGHSLGGSMAAIVSIMLRNTSVRAYAFCYGAAPCLCERVSKRYQSYMLGICVGDDVITRLSYESFVDLKKKLFLICKLDASESDLEQQGHICKGRWIHQADLCHSRRLWGPWKQVYIRRNEQGILEATQIDTKQLDSLVISLRFILDHAPITYDEVLWEYKTINSE